MKNWRQVSNCFVSVVLLFLITVNTASQEISAGHFATFKQLLQERKIQLTDNALLAALRNPDPHVRYLAALVLAEDKVTNATPEMEKALSTEKVPETRINIALALAQLGDEKGITVLKEACNNVGMPPHLRMYSAKYMLDLHHESCLSATRDVLRSSPDVGSRVLALSQLPRFQRISTADSKKIVDSLVAALVDPEPEVRIAASHALAELGNQSTLPDLQKVIATEQDEAVRSIMQTDLQKLQQKEVH